MFLVYVRPLIIKESGIYRFMGYGFLEKSPVSYVTIWVQIGMIHNQATFFSHALFIGLVCNLGPSTSRCDDKRHVGLHWPS